MLTPRARTLLPALAALLVAATTAQAQNNPDFRLNNRSGITINEVYVSSSRNQNWGPDRLGNNVLASGQSLTMSLPAGQCVNDIRVVYQNGTAQERRGVNTCEITDFNVTR